jgi:hypothetical protein
MSKEPKKSRKRSSSRPKLSPFARAKFPRIDELTKQDRAVVSAVVRNLHYVESNGSENDVESTRRRIANVVARVRDESLVGMDEKPKRALSAYILFGMEQNLKKMSVGARGKMLGDMWQKLSEEKKQGYKEKAAALANEVRDHRKNFDEDVKDAKIELAEERREKKAAEKEAKDNGVKKRRAPQTPKSEKRSATTKSKKSPESETKSKTKSETKEPAKYAKYTKQQLLDKLQGSKYRDATMATLGKMTLPKLVAEALMDDKKRNAA